MNYLKIIPFVLLVLAANSGFSQAVYPVDWLNLINTSYSQYTVYSTNATGWNTAGAFSRNMLLASEAGEIEFKVDQSWGDCIIGFSNVDGNQDWTSVKYGIKFGANIEAVQFGSVMYPMTTSGGLHTYKITKDLNGFISCYLDGVLQYTYPVAESSHLFIDVAFLTNNYTIQDFKSSFKQDFEVNWTHIAETDIFVQQNSAFSFQTTGSFGVSGITSLNQLSFIANDYVSFSIPPDPGTGTGVTGNQIIGLTPNYISYSLGDIELGIMIYQGGSPVEIWSNGAPVATIADYIEGDRYKIVLNNTFSEYDVYHNGLLVHSEVTSSQDVNFICSFENLSAGIENPRCSSPYRPSTQNIIPSSSASTVVYQLDQNQKLKIQYENEYGEFRTGDLIYKVYDQNMSLLASSDHSGLTSGLGTSIPLSVGFNEIEMDFSSYSLVPGQTYQMIIENVKKEKSYINFKL